MNLGKWAVNKILEDNNKIKTIIALYNGRFQPFGRHHYEAFQFLQNKFGSKNTFIGTTDKHGGSQHPFNFNEKKKIINKYGIQNVVKIDDPYRAEEILNKYNPETTAAVYMVGAKDANRLKSKFFIPFKGKVDIGYEDGAYLIIAPHITLSIPQFGEMSGTTIRKVLGSNIIDDKKKKIFKDIFGFFDESIYRLITKKLENIQENKNNFIKNNNIIEINKLFSKKWWKHLFEDIKIPINIGDTVLGGKFKNKKIVVKSISKNEKGDITINGKPLLRFRLLPKEKIKESKNMILEGGAAGHMNHIFDDNNLKFKDIQKIIELGLSGQLNVESSVQEKTDGQAMSVTWKDNKLKAARNKGTIINPMDYNQLSLKFKGRGNIEKAFTFAMKDLENAVSKLSDKQKNKIFKDGRTFVNIEIIYPDTENIISYDVAALQLHNAIEYDDKANIIGIDNEAGRMLEGMIRQVNANIQKHFNIIKPNVLKIKPHQDFSEKRQYYFDKLNKLMKEFNLNDDDTLGLYHERWWEKFILDKANHLKYKIPIDVLNNLAKRWAFNNKSFLLNKNNINDEIFLEWAKNFDKNDHQKQVKINMFPYEVLIMQLGTEILSNVENFLSTNPDKTIQNIRKKVENAISTIKNSNDIHKLNIVNDQLKKIQASGGLDKIIPAEGLVFVYGGRTYKITAQFAPINQIVGLLTF